MSAAAMALRWYSFKVLLISPQVSSTLLSLILFFEPLLQRREVFNERARVHVARASELFERFLPWAALANRQHGCELFAGGGISIVRALMQRALEACGLAKRAVKLELKNEREEVARVRSIPRNMCFGSGVEIRLGAGHRWSNTLVLLAQLPPGLIVVLGCHFAREHLPAPLIDELAEWQEGDPLERQLHLLVDQCVVTGFYITDELDRMEVLWSH